MIGISKTFRQYLLGIVTVAALLPVAGSQVAAQSASGRPKSLVDIMRDHNDGILGLQRDGAQIEYIRGIAPHRGIFKETVAIVDNASPPNLICSGVLMDKLAVLTAAHCVCHGRLDHEGVSAHVAFGFDIGEFAYRKLIAIDTKKTELFDKKKDPKFCDRYSVPRHRNKTMRGKDFALVFLNPAATAGALQFAYEGYGKKNEFIDPEAEKLSQKERGQTPSPVPSPYVVAPARVATPNLYLASSLKKLHGAGFGISKFGDPDAVGKKLFAELRIHDKICGTNFRRATYGCELGREAVLIDPLADSCGGDSGGPVFAVVGDKYFLVGITSRGIPRGSCGDGGIYSLITPRIINWMRASGVTVHSRRYAQQ